MSDLLHDQATVNVVFYACMGVSVFFSLSTVKHLIAIRRRWETVDQAFKAHGSALSALAQTMELFRSRVAECEVMHQVARDRLDGIDAGLLRQVSSYHRTVTRALDLSIGAGGYGRRSYDGAVAEAVAEMYSDPARLWEEDLHIDPYEQCQACGDVFRASEMAGHSGECRHNPETGEDEDKENVDGEA